MAINYEFVKNYDDAVGAYNVTLKARELKHDAIVGKYGIKEIDKKYIYFENEDKMPTNLYSDYELFNENDKNDIKYFLESFDDEIYYANMAYKLDKNFNCCIELNNINSFNKCKDGKEYSCERYSSYLNVLNKEELILECKKNYYMAEQLKYRYELFRSFIFTDIIHPAKAFLGDNDSAVFDEKTLKDKTNKEVVKTLNKRIDDLLKNSKITNKNISSLSVIDKIDPFKYASDIKKDINEFAYETMKYYYRINALISRMSFENDFNHLVLGEETAEQFDKELDYFGLNNIEMMFGIVKKDNGYDYEARIRGIADLEFAFSTLDDDIYDDSDLD